MENNNLLLIAHASTIVAKIAARKKKQKLAVKRIWARKWLLRRDIGGSDVQSLIFREICIEDPESFFKFTRMHKSSFDELLALVSSRISRRDTNMRMSIPAKIRLLVTLHYLATGNSFVCLSWYFRISVSAISKIVPETVRAIYVVLKADYLKTPHSLSEWSNIAQDFENIWNFPHCLGAMDGKHIAFRAKKKDGSFYHNYKGYNSIVLLALVDANYNFLYVDVGCNGRISDGGVFANSNLCHVIENNLLQFPVEKKLVGTDVVAPFVIVADEAFKLTTRILKPYGTRASIHEKVFNYRLSRARRVVENAFGILATKFQVLQKEIKLPVEKINIIFAVTQDIISHYYLLQSVLQETSSIGVLKMDSSNILQLVEAGYTEFIQKVQFFDNSPDFIDIKYETNCGDINSPIREQSGCGNIKYGEDYEFIISITLLDIPKSVTNYTVKIDEASISSENVLIQINIENACPCMDENIGVEKSTYCNEHGTFKCGMCDCEAGWVGKTCQCDLENYHDLKELDEQCRLPITQLGGQSNISYTGSTCSDRGECFCGQCTCNRGFSGQHCECQQCPYYAGLECGGVERATCSCGKCNCHIGWTGERCDCTTSNSTCLAPMLNKICSGNGFCDCGTCRCAEKFYGQYCERHLSLGNAFCDYYEPCINCMLSIKENIPCANQTQLCSSTSGTQIHKYIIKYYEELPTSPVNCIIRFSHDENEQCDFRFSYEFDNDDQTILSIENNKCEKINVAYFASLVLGMTFLLGAVGLALFKMCVTIHDKREFAKFQLEQKSTQYHFESPIYRSPLTKYEIPEELRNSYRQQKDEVEFYATQNYVHEDHKL